MVTPPTALVPREFIWYRSIEIGQNQPSALSLKGRGGTSDVAFAQCTSEELRKRAALQVSSFSEISPPALQGASFAQISPKVAPMPIGYRKAAKN
eukprot:g20975.t1